MKNKILLIDDDADDRLLFCEAVEEVAPQVSCYNAENGRIALAQLATQKIELPDLIFLDVNMPIMDGWQCLTALKGNPTYQDIPVIMYSTSSYHEDIVKAKENGALCFFTKPLSFNDLKKSLTIISTHLSNKTLDKLLDASPQFL